MTVSEAAAYLGKSRWTIVRYIKQGDPPLPARRFGTSGPWMIERADVETYAELL